MRIIACMASTIDGRIGPAQADHFVPISSRQDMAHLLKIRDQADGILFGAGTFRAWPKVHHGQDRTRVAQHFILSRSLDLDPAAPLFQDPGLGVTIFTSPESPTHPPLAPHVEILRIPEGSRQLPSILDLIEARGIQTLLIEGGGQVLQQFIAAQKLQELYLTLSPQILGDAAAPALLGNRLLGVLPKMRILDQHTLGDEVYLHLALTYKQTSL